MTVYTVSSADDLMSEPLSTLVAGTYTTRGRALDECVAYIMERLKNRQDFARSMLHDENHPEAGKFLIEHKDGTVGVRRGCLNKLKEFIRDELGGTGCYYVYDGGDCTWHFDVDENDLCGDAWTLVTWGDSDVEDPTFTTPFPELFTDEDKAVANAVKYAKDLMDSRGYEASERDSLAELVRKDLKENGQTRLDLDDGAAVHWVLYHFGMETENTDAEGLVCRKCGHQLTRRNVTPGYQFHCPNCDEDMYGFEARRQ
jgi:predicted RNA-binding Zn-ribbon protein involved in translation (DUF1610 family)